MITIMMKLTWALDSELRTCSCYSIRKQTTLAWSSAVPAAVRWLLDTNYQRASLHSRSPCCDSCLNPKLIISLLIRDNILPAVFSRLAISGSSNHAELSTRWNKRQAQSMCTYRPLLEHWLHHMALRRHTCNRDTSRKLKMFFNSVDKVESCSLQGSFQVLGRLRDHIWHHTASGNLSLRFRLCFGTITESWGHYSFKNTSTQGHEGGWF